MQSIIKDFVNGAVSAYMTEINKKNISGSITKKNLDISELDVFPDALLQHGLPVLVKKGTIKNISIHIPTKFRTDPVKIKIDSVVILGSLCTHDPTRDEVINMKIHMLNAYQFFRKRFKMLLGIMPKQGFLSIVRTIFSNIILDINHIHVIIEYPSGVQDSSDDFSRLSDLSVSKFSLSRASRLSDAKSPQSSALDLEEEENDSDDENNDNSDQYVNDFNQKLMNDDINEIELDDFAEESSDETSSISEELEMPANRMTTYKQFGTVYCNSDDQKNPPMKKTKVTQIGITIKNLLVHNPENFTNPTPFSITKEAVFTDLAISMDVNRPSVSTNSNEECEAEMQQLYKSKKHKWILEPFTFSALMKFEKGNPQLFFEPFIKTVMANIREEYIPIILDLMKGVGTFASKFSVAHIPKPSIDDPKAFWCYLHKCAVSKISNATFDFSKSLSLLLKRSIYLRNYKKVDPKSQQICKEMEESLDYSTIVAFRAAYLLAGKRRNAKGIPVTSAMTKKIKKITMVDPIYIVTKLVRMLAVNFKGESVTISLLRNTGQKHVVIDIKKPSFKFEKDLKAYIIHAVVSSICVKHIKDTEQVVFKSLDNNTSEMKANMRIPFLSYSNWSLSLDMSKNNYSLKLEGILQLLTDLGLIELFAATKSASSNQKRNFELNVQVLSSALRVVGSQNNRALQLAFDKFLLSTDPKTLVRTIKLDNSWISLIADNEAKVSSDFSLSGSIIGKDISFAVPLFSCAIPFNYIVVIDDFIRIAMRYQGLFRDAAFPKFDFNFKLDLKGMNVIIKIPNSSERANLQIRNIVLTLKGSDLNILLASIEMQKLFSLKNLSVNLNKTSLDLKISSIYAKVFMLLSLIPKDALQMIQQQRESIENQQDNKIEEDSETNSEPDQDKDKEYSDESQESQEKSIEIVPIKIGFGIDECNIDLALTSSERFNLNVLNVKASVDKNIIKASAVLNQCAFQSQIIAQKIIFQADLKLSKISEVKIIIDNCNISPSKSLINYFLNTNMSSYEVAFPHELGLKLSFIMNQISISNDFVMKDFSTELLLSNSKFDISVGLDSVNSSFLKFTAKDVVKMNMDIEQKTLDIVVNLEDMTIFVIPLFDLISKLPTLNGPSPQIKLNLTLKPLHVNCVFGEDCLNIMFNSPLTLKLDTLHGPIPYVDLDMSNFVVYLNNNEIIRLDTIKFYLEKKMVIDIPELYVKLSVIKIYKILKMLSTIPTKSLFKNSQTTPVLYDLPIESIEAKIPFIEIMIHQTKSRRCVLFKLLGTELNVQNANSKTNLLASTQIHLDASDGFQSFSLAPPFNVTCKGEFSKEENKIFLDSPDSIKIEFSSYLLNQIIKNLTASEDAAEQPYSISNETGTDISIIINNKVHEIESQEILPNVGNFIESDIKVKIGEIVNSIKIDSLASAISYPLFFGKNYILVWMDLKRLQIRLLSPISLINRSNTDLELRFLNEEVSLDEGETYSLNYTIEKLDSIGIKIDGKYNDVELNESQVIHIDNNYVVITSKRKEETLHTTIEFSAPYYVKNELITDITLRLKDSQNNTHDVVIKPCEMIPFPWFPPVSDSISFDLLDTPHVKGVHVDLQLKDNNNNNNNKFVIPTLTNESKPFNLQFTILNEKYIFISSLIIFFNSLSIPLRFGLSSKEKLENIEKCILNQSIPEFFPFQSSQTAWKRDNPMMFSPSEKDSKNIRFYVTTNYSTKWSEKPISMSNFNQVEDLMIPFDDTKVTYAHFHFISHSSIRPNTFIFFILPKFAINNLTNRTFSLNLFDGGAVEMPPNSIVPVTLIRKSFDFSIAVVNQENVQPSSPRKSSRKKHTKVVVPKKYLVYSHKVNMLKLNSQFIKVNSIDSPVLLQLSTENEIQYITILLNRTLPYLFVNKSKSKVVFIQKDTADFAHTVMPNQTLPFFIFDENMPTVIYCEIGNQMKIELDVNIPSFPVKINNPDEKVNGLKYYYYVDLSMTEGSTITVCNVDDESLNNSSPSLSSIPSSNSNLSLDEMSSTMNLSDLPHSNHYRIDFTFHFNFLSILLITKSYQELLRLTLRDISVNSIIHSYYSRSLIKVGSIKVDDQNQYAIYPSVFQIVPKDGKPAVTLKIESFGTNKYGSFEVQIQPITVRIDLSFVADVIGSILFSENEIEDDYEKYNLVDSTNNNDKSLNKIELKMNEISLTEIVSNFVPKNKKYHINCIIIHPFTIQVSFKTKTTRDDHPLQSYYHFNRMYGLIPSLNNISITIEDSHVFQNLSGTTADIVLKIGNDIKKLILTQLSLRKIIYESGNMVVSAAKGIVNLAKKNETNADNNNNNKNENDATKANADEASSSGGGGGGGGKLSGLLSKTGSVLSIGEMTLCHISSVLDLYTDSPPNIRTDETSLGALKWGVSSLVNSVSKGAKVLVSEPIKRGNVNGKKNYCGYIEGTGVGIAKCAAFGVSGLCNFGASLLSSTKRIFFTEKGIFIDKRELEPLLGMHRRGNEKLLWFAGSVTSNLIEVYSSSVFCLEGNKFIQKVSRAEIDEDQKSVKIFDDNQKEHIFNFNDIIQAVHFYNIIQSQLLRQKIIDSTSNQLP